MLGAGWLPCPNRRQTFIVGGYNTCRWVLAPIYPPLSLSHSTHLWVSPELRAPAHQTEGDEVSATGFALPIVEEEPYGVAVGQEGWAPPGHVLGTPKYPQGGGGSPP